MAMLPAGLLLACLAGPALADGRTTGSPLLLSPGELRRVEQLSRRIWEHPELGYLENRTSSLLQDALQEAGFDVQTGVAEMPTAFVARRGTGRPVIALLAEMDALPGMSQAAMPQHGPRMEEPDGPGHACGHNLFGAAAVGAARTIAAWLETTGSAGQVRVYGTPAEEGGSGKAYMVSAGVFDDVDIVLHWHPADGNDASQSTSMANINGRFVFEGRSAHASIAPEQGRSALDGVEAMNFMANLMREHVPAGTRIHYVISDGGNAPNVVPARAAAHYYVRHRDPAVVQDVASRLQAAAEGAATGTGTQVRFEPLGGVYSLLPNHTLGRLVHSVMAEAGGPGLAASDEAYAEALRTTLERPGVLATMATVRPYRDDGHSSASTDVGDVSWVVPTAGFSTATWIPGTPAHSWQATSASGHAVGTRGAIHAANLLAEVARRIYADPGIVTQAWNEFRDARPAGFSYRSFTGRQTPPLDYRRPAQ
ncbi:MAG: amidohydrolase [Pseudoxanthomonas suwonensis]|nr:amidohydrolase [Pseudoxanthomonas suwonensis]